MGLKWRSGLAAAAAAGLLATAGPASAVVMIATFTGQVSDGADATNFFGLGATLDNASFTATFRYDTALGLAETIPGVRDARSGGPDLGAPSPILSATLRINGVTDVLPTSLNGRANVFIGPDTWEQTFLYTDAFYMNGALQAYGAMRLFVLSAPTPTLLTTPYVGGNMTFNSGPDTINEVTRFQYDGASDLYSLNYSALLAPDLVTLAPAPVPEPGVWALLIGGFGGMGAALRRRRRALV
jgi:hypothetical protein